MKAKKVDKEFNLLKSEFNLKFSAFNLNCLYRFVWPVINFYLILGLPFDFHRARICKIPVKWTCKLAQSSIP